MKTCPYCGGGAMEITSNGDDERRFVCNGWIEDGYDEPGCGSEWGEPFTETDDPGEGLP